MSLDSWSSAERIRSRTDASYRDISKLISDFLWDVPSAVQVDSTKMWLKPTRAHSASYYPNKLWTGKLGELSLEVFWEYGDIWGYCSVARGSGGCEGPGTQSWWKSVDDCHSIECMLQVQFALYIWTPLWYRHGHILVFQRYSIHTICSILYEYTWNRIRYCWCVFPQDFLWDFLNHQEGPRIRDRLSHGEINLETFPREIANQIVGFAVTILCRFSDEAMFSLKVGTSILFSEDFFLLFWIQNMILEFYDWIFPDNCFLCKWNIPPSKKMWNLVL